MNELDILVRAEKYIADLANGIDPLTGAELGDEQIVNNVRISRCLFYVSGVLRKVIDNGGEVTAAPKVKPKRAELADFALTDEQAAALVPEKYDISLSKVAAVINRDIDENVMNKMKTTVISRWLMDKGLLTEIVSGGRNRKIPTPAGESIGMTEKQLTTASGVPYKGITYSPDAQQFIFDNIDSIAALAAAENAAKASEKAEKEEQKARSTANAGKPWTKEDDDRLAGMYRDGAGIKELCAELGRTRGSIDARLAKLGFDVRSAYYPKDTPVPSPDIGYDAPEPFVPDNFDDVPLPPEPGNYGLDESSPYFGNAAIPNEDVDE